MFLNVYLRVEGISAGLGRQRMTSALPFCLGHQVAILLTPATALPFPVGLRAKKQKKKHNFKHKLLHGTSRTWRFLFACEHKHIQTQTVQHIRTCIKLTHARLTEQAHTALDAPDMTQANSDTAPPFASGVELALGGVGLAHLFSVNIRRR